MNHLPKPDWQTSLPADVVQISRPAAQGPVLLVCEHASNVIPEGLGRLGLDEAAASSHIAWDPGAMKVAEHLSTMLDAPLVSQKISRLVYDCNRPPESPEAVRDQSEAFTIPGNAGLSNSQRADRATYIYEPFRQELARQVETRPETVLVTIHSFTPVYNGAKRAVEVGILHDSDSRLADAMLAAAAENPAYRTERNQPYGPEDGVTHTLVEHALPHGALNVMVELRNDLLADAASQEKLAAWLGEILTSALNATREDP